MAPPPLFPNHPSSSRSGDAAPTWEGRQANRQLARLAKALGHPARVQMLRYLIKQNSSVFKEFVKGLSLAQSTVSQHLKVLRQAGLVVGTPQGVQVNYGVDNEELKRLKILVAAL